MQINFTQCKKPEMVIFKSKQKKFEGDLKIRLCGKRLHPTKSLKYLGVKIDTNLSWQYHVNDLSIKLNGANALLFKLRKYVSLFFPPIVLQDGGHENYMKRKYKLISNNTYLINSYESKIHHVLATTTTLFITNSYIS